MPRSYISHALRLVVAERARWCCEYCFLHQDDSPDQHQVDHIIPIKHGGPTASENLAFAYTECNWFKGTDFAAIDQLSGEIVSLFNPAHSNGEHFGLEGARLAAFSATGRVTVDLLRLNTAARLLERETLIVSGRYPPSLVG